MALGHASQAQRDAELRASVAKAGQEFDRAWKERELAARAAMPVVDYQPGDRIIFASSSAAEGWRPGTVVRATPARVLVAYSFKYDIERAKKTAVPAKQHQTWKRRDEVRKR